jgi:hypothetical protein
MLRCWSAVLAMLALTAYAPAISPPVRAPVAYVAVRSLDGLLADSHYLAPFLGGEETLKQVDAFLKTLIGGNGWAGADGQRPLGVYFLWPDNPNDLLAQRVPAVVFVPVADEQRFLGLLDKLGCRPCKAERGQHRLTVPQVGEVMLRFANGYAYAAEKAALLNGPFPDPKEFVPSSGRQPTLAARLRAERIPDSYKELLNGIAARFGQAIDQYMGGDRQPDESDAQFQQRQFYVNQAKQFVPKVVEFLGGQVIDQIRELSLEANVVAAEATLTLDLAVVPRKPDSTLAAFSRYAGRARSRFTNLLPSADWGAVAHFPAPQRADTLPNPETFGDIIRQQVPARYREAALQGVHIFFDTLAADGWDWCFVQLKSEPSRPGAILFGLKIRDGRKFDHLLRDTLRMLPAEQKGGFSIRWNHDRRGNARIHRIMEEGEKEDDYLAISEEVVFLGIGKGGLDAVRTALDRFGKEPAPPSPALRFEASGDFLLEDAAPQLLAQLRKAGARSDRAVLHARGSVRGGSELRLHLEITPYFLRLLRFWTGDEDKK